MSTLTAKLRLRRDFFQRWDEPREHEPAQAYFSRLAGLNLQSSARVFAEEMGFDGREMPPADCLEAVRHLPIRGLDRLVHATPVVTKRHVSLLGETVRRRHWIGDTPRWCPGCIAESAHYRVFWGLSTFTVCPVHGCPIETGTGGSDSLSWWHPSIAFTPNGRTIGRRMDRPAEPMPSFERWLLGRLGIIRPWSVSLFEDVSLAQAIDTVDLLGRVALRGRSLRAPRVGVAGLTRREVVARGFEVVLGGPAAIEAVFERVAMETGDLSEPRWRAGVLSHAYGWLHHAVLKRGRAQTYCPAVKAALIDVTLRHVAFAGSATSLEAPATEAFHLPRRAVAALLGVGVRTLDRIASHSGIVPERIGERFIMFARPQVEQLCQALAGTLPRSAAIEATGLASTDFDQIEKLGLIRALYQAGGRKRQHGRFLQRDLENLLTIEGCGSAEAAGTDQLSFAAFARASNLSHGEIAALIASRRLRPVGRDPTLAGFPALLLDTSELGRLVTSRIAMPRKGGRQRRTGLADGLTRVDAAAMLGVDTPTIQALLAQGYLDIVAGQGRSQARIDAASLQAFRSTYAPAVAYVSILGCSPWFAPPSPERAGGDHPRQAGGL